MRKVKIRYPKIEYEEVEVELMPYLKKIDAEAYYSQETKAVEIRIPTKWEGLSNFVAEIPLDKITEEKEEIWEEIYGSGLYAFLEKYQDDVIWKGDY